MAEMHPEGIFLEPAIYHVWIFKKQQKRTTTLNLVKDQLFMCRLYMVS